MVQYDRSDGRGTGGAGVQWGAGGAAGGDKGRAGHARGSDPQGGGMCMVQQERKGELRGQDGGVQEKSFLFMAIEGEQ